MNRFLFLFLLFISSTVVGQQNATVVGTLDYSEDVSDIWGYKDEENNVEYAIVGIFDGVSIVSLADPTNPTEVAFIPGAGSIWRDMKTFGEYAYVTNETSGGVLIVNLSDLPNSVSSSEFTPQLTVNGQLGTLTSAHNIYIDENGFAYVVGSDLNSGGMLVFDLNTDPENPTFVGASQPRYSHDIYVVDDIAYASDVFAGIFTIYDVSNKSNIVELATNPTSFFFTHNAWLSDDGDYLFTTDEVGDAPIGSFDVSDFNNIQGPLDEFRPPASVGSGVIPHNVHFLNGYLVISYYTDGLIVVDAHEPDIMVQVAQIDTWPGGDGGFNGCWGATPFLPSGLVLASDIQTGLYVIDVNYTRASYIRGNITDFNSGLAINDATITISSAGITESSDLVGDYKTGLAQEGTVSVTYSKPGYNSQTIDVQLVAGQITIQDVALVPAMSFQLNAQVVEFGSGIPIPNAEIRLVSSQFDFNETTDASGNINIVTFFGDDYKIVAGAWGWETIVNDNVAIDENSNNLTIELAPGFVDPFELDLGWTVSGDASTGLWERGEPVGTTLGGQPSNPDFDIDSDVGEVAYVTGNGGGGAGTDDIDGGNSVLTSPVFDATTLNEPHIAYNLWFVNGGGNGNPDDFVSVSLTDGTNTVVLETITNSNGAWLPRTDFNIEDFLTPSNTMQIIVEAVDQGNGHVSEAAFDFFALFDGDPSTSIEDVIDEGLKIEAFPSPFYESITINYNLEDSWNGEEVELIISDGLGRIVSVTPINNAQGTLQVGGKLSQGVYFIRFRTADDRSSKLEKVVKLK
ncbi:MAG: choice-of-anchor B family protein [Bacteroidota bacterium]